MSTRLYRANHVQRHQVHKTNFWRRITFPMFLLVVSTPLTTTQKYSRFLRRDNLLYTPTISVNFRSYCDLSCNGMFRFNQQKICVSIGLLKKIAVHGSQNTSSKLWHYHVYISPDIPLLLIRLVNWYINNWSQQGYMFKVFHNYRHNQWTILWW